MDTQRQVPPDSISQTPEVNDSKSRMTLFEQREKDFIEFVKEAPQSSQVEAEKEDQPLSGLQCLLALTEILEKAAQLRLTNFDLEQRIETLQRLKQIAEVQSELRNAKLDINANGIARGKKGKAADEVDGRRLKRTLSAESLHTPASKFEQSPDEFNFSKHRTTLGKGSKLSETWGKMKDKLAHKDSVQTPLSSKPSRRRQSSHDSTLTMKHSVSVESHTSQTSQSCVQFTQREINISPPATDDFGGVWLGDDGNAGNGGSEFGGVYLGPPSPSQAPTEVSLIIEVNKTDCDKMAAKEINKQELGRQASDPVIGRYQHLTKPNLSWSRVRAISNDESQDWLQKSLHKDNQSPPLRKKSSKTKLLAILPGAEQKSAKKGSPGEDLPKEFRKKIEEWHMMKECSAPGTADGQPAAKTAKGGKTKNQRFKNKKKGGLLKQRSKSAERVEESSFGRQHSDDFEEKLREWSVKQGYHPTYYSEVRTSIGSSDSVSEVSSRESRDRLGSKVESVEIAGGVSDQSLSLNTHGSSCTNSSNSLSPSAAVYFLSAENLHTLYEISQSADVIFHREPTTTPRVSRFLSKSEETINSSAAHSTLLNSEKKHTASVSSSHVDVYARASDRSLEKHLSLYHVASDTSINADTAMSSQGATATNSHHSIDGVGESSLDIPSTISTWTSSNNSLPLDSLAKSAAVLTSENTANRDLIEQSQQDGKDICTDRKFAHPIQKPSEKSLEKDLDKSELTTKDREDSCQLPRSGNDSSTCDSRVPILETGDTSDTDKANTAEVAKADNEKAAKNDYLANEIETGGKDVAFKKATSDNSIANEKSTCNGNTEANGASDQSMQTGGSSLQVQTLKDDVLFQNPMQPAESDAPGNRSETPEEVESPTEDSYDINSNVTNNMHNKDTAEISATLEGPLVLHLSTDVPLKTRLKSLALEYQAEEMKRQTCRTPTSNKLSSTFPGSGICSKPKSKGQQELGSLANNRYSRVTQPLHTDLHRLKSADQFIYEQTSHQPTKPYTRQSTVGGFNLPALGTRREMHEKPKEGTVKKALSMFIDSGTFNAQFGTDFAKPAPRSQPS